MQDTTTAQHSTAARKLEVQSRCEWDQNWSSRASLHKMTFLLAQHSCKFLAVLLYNSSGELSTYLHQKLSQHVLNESQAHVPITLKSE